MQQVLVLNASYEPLNVTTVRRAHVLVFKGKAEVIEELDQPLRSATVAFPRPHVIRLVQYVRGPPTLPRKISRRALFARDGWRCMYCGPPGGKPRPPAAVLFIHLATPRIPNGWQPYLNGFGETATATA